MTALPTSTTHLSSHLLRLISHLLTASMALTVFSMLVTLSQLIISHQPVRLPRTPQLLASWLSVVLQPRTSTHTVPAEETIKSWLVVLSLTSVLSTRWSLRSAPLLSTFPPA